MKKIHCRLSDALWENNMTPEGLEEMTGLPMDRVRLYCDDALDIVELPEVESILDALGSDKLSDLFKVEDDSVAKDDPGLDAVDEWHSPCPATDGHRHDWYKDMEVSSSVYQEYECRACGKRIHLIW